jgi:hypothetical protein
MIHGGHKQSHITPSQAAFATIIFVGACKTHLNQFWKTHLALQHVTTPKKKEPMLRSCLFRVVSCGADGSATSTMVHGRFIPSFPIGPANAKTVCLQQSHYRGRHLSGSHLCKWGSKLEQNHTRCDAQ